MTPGANALDVSSEVRETMAELKKSFPDGVDYKIPYDPKYFRKSFFEISHYHSVMKPLHWLCLLSSCSCKHGVHPLFL